MDPRFNFEGVEQERAAARVVFGIVELALRSSTVSARPLRPVGFHVAGETWSFDAQRRPIFQPVPHPNAAATVRMSASILARLFLDGGATLVPDDEIALWGDPGAIRAFAEAIQPGYRLLDLRSRENGIGREH